jgi:hypothetical protein
MGTEKGPLESVVVLMNPAPSITISCDAEPVVFADDANSSPTLPEIVTIPVTADTSGSLSQRSNQSSPNGKRRRRMPRKKK